MFVRNGVKDVAGMERREGLRGREVNVEVDVL